VSISTFVGVRTRTVSVVGNLVGHWPHCFTAYKIYKKRTRALQCLWSILFTEISPTWFGRSSGHPQGDALMEGNKNANVVNCVTITT